MATSKPTCRIYIVSKEESAEWVPLCNEYRLEKGLPPYPAGKQFGCECNKAIKKTNTDPKLWNRAVQFYKKQSTRAWIELAIASKLHLGQSNASKIAVVEAVMAHYNNNFGEKPTSTKTVETLATTSTSTGKNGFIEAILTQFVQQLHKHGVVPAKKFPTKKLLSPRIVASTHTALLVRILSLSCFSLLLLSLASLSCFFLSMIYLSLFIYPSTLYLCLSTYVFLSLSV